VKKINWTFRLVALPIIAGLTAFIFVSAFAPLSEVTTVECGVSTCAAR